MTQHPYKKPVVVVICINHQYSDAIDGVTSTASSLYNVLFQQLPKDHFRRTWSTL